MNRWTLNLIDEIEKMQRMFDRFVYGLPGTEGGIPSRMAFLPGRSARAYPLVNIREDAENYYIDALAPGVDPAELDISVTGDQISISGEKKNYPDDVDPDRIHRNERAAGKFIRTVTLGAEINSDGVKAVFKNGILEMTLPKTEEAKPKKISVNVE